MGISRRLCEVRDREFGRSQKAMWKAWDINPSTLNRWLHGTIPDAAWYDLLAEKLGLSIGEVHELCMAGRGNKDAPDTALVTAAS